MSGSSMQHLVFMKGEAESHCHLSPPFSSAKLGGQGEGWRWEEGKCKQQQALKLLKNRSSGQTPYR